MKHVQKIGIPTLAEKWIAANVRPETEPGEYQSPNKSIPSIAENFLGLVKSGDSRSTLNKISSQTIKKSPEVSSILKRRSFEQSNASTGSGTKLLIQILMMDSSNSIYLQSIRCKLRRIRPARVQGQLVKPVTTQLRYWAVVLLERERFIAVIRDSLTAAIQTWIMIELVDAIK